MGSISQKSLGSIHNSSQVSLKEQKRLQKQQPKQVSKNSSITTKKRKQNQLQMDNPQLHDQSSMFDINGKISASKAFDGSLLDGADLSNIIKKYDQSQHEDLGMSFRVASRVIRDSVILESNHDSILFSSPQKPKMAKRKRSLSEVKRYRSPKKLREEDEVVVQEGELLKICPGVSRLSMKASRDLNGGIQFIDRWCQITQNKFRYYRNKIVAYRQPERPLLSIPLEDIKGIVKTKLNKDETQFEIILKKALTEYVLEKSMMEKAYQSPSKSPNQSPSPEREVVPGHLMRQPASRNSNHHHQIGSFHKIHHSIKGSNLKFKPVHEQSFSGTGRISSPIDLQQYNSVQSIIDTVDRNCWSKREVEWFNIEERLVFKNNKQNLLEGDAKLISSWIRTLYRQRDVLILEKEAENQSERRSTTYQLTFANKN